MRAGDEVRLSDGFLALHRHPKVPAQVRGVVEAVEYAQSWDTWTLTAVKVNGQWHPAPMWEKT